MRTGREALIQRVRETLPAFLRMADAGMHSLFWLDGHTALSPGGHNGPYFDLESPARNSAHWLGTLSIAHRLTGDERYRTAGAGLSRYLQTRSPAIDGTTVHRQRFPKDWTNGVIGPAWVSEGLVPAARCFAEEEALAAGAHNLRALPFDLERGLWRTLDPATRTSVIDQTVNHQLYCTAVAAEFSEDRILQERVGTFIEVGLPQLLRTGPSGHIEHHAARGRGAILRRATLKQLLGRTWPLLGRTAMRPGSVQDPAARDLGYHLFTLYSYFRLAKSASRPDLLERGVVAEAMAALPALVASKSFEGNAFTYGYNVPGFELPFVALVAKDAEETLHSASLDALDVQLALTLEPTTGLLTRATTDPLVLAARGYELGLLHLELAD